MRFPALPRLTPGRGFRSTTVGCRTPLYWWLVQNASLGVEMPEGTENMSLLEASRFRCEYQYARDGSAISAWSQHSRHDRNSLGTEEKRHDT